MDPAKALARATGLSCWPEGVKVEATAALDASELGLGEGRTNQNFIATAPDGTRYFVRIGLDLPAFGVTRAKEQAAARAAAAAGIGAAILHTELPDVLVTSFCKGRALTEEQAHAACGGQTRRCLARSAPQFASSMPRKCLLNCLRSCLPVRLAGRRLICLAGLRVPARAAFRGCRC